jgi:hypothetical protein
LCKINGAELKEIPDHWNIKNQTKYEYSNPDDQWNQVVFIKNGGEYRNNKKIG